MSASPFKFLDSYTRADIGDFFGRDKETDELFRRCFISPILVVYGGSGTGKTSLVQCGLSSRFQDSDWLPVPVRRSGEMLASLTEAVREHTLTPKESGDLNELVTNLYLDHFKPIWFLFDQFEELFIFGSHTEAEDFFTAIGDLLDCHAERSRGGHARAIFIVREEYLAELTRYESIIPGLIENRYRVERLTQRHAMEVVEKLCGAHSIPCAEGFSAALVSRLDPEGQGIELSYLQVFLDRCWRTRQGDEPFSPALLERIGHVDDMLGAFLDEQVADTPEPQRSESLLKTFVSDQGTKRQLTSTEAHDWVQTIGVGMELSEVERLLQVFVAKRLLKDRDERGRYELLHDALARQIFQRITRAEQELIEVRQFVHQAHGQFLKRGVKLTANDLTYLRPYRNQLHLKGEMKEFVEGAFGEEERTARRKKLRTRLLLGGLLVTVVICGKYLADTQKRLARERAVNESNRLAQLAIELVEQDPLSAFLLAERAFLLDSSIQAERAVMKAYNGSYTEVMRSSFPRAILAEDRRSFTLVDHDTFTVHDPDGRFRFGGGMRDIWSALNFYYLDGGKFLFVPDSTVRIYDIDGNVVFECPSIDFRELSGPLGIVAAAKSGLVMCERGKVRILPWTSEVNWTLFQKSSENYGSPDSVQVYLLQRESMVQFSLADEMHLVARHPYPEELHADVEHAMLKFGDGSMLCVLQDRLFVRPLVNGAWREITDLRSSWVHYKGKAIVAEGHGSFHYALPNAAGFKMGHFDKNFLWSGVAGATVLCSSDNGHGQPSCKLTPTGILDQRIGMPAQGMEFPGTFIWGPDNVYFRILTSVNPEVDRLTWYSFDGLKVDSLDVPTVTSSGGTRHIYLDTLSDGASVVCTFHDENIDGSTQRQCRVYINGRVVYFSVVPSTHYPYGHQIFQVFSDTLAWLVRDIGNSALVRLDTCLECFGTIANSDYSRTGVSGLLSFPGDLASASSNVIVRSIGGSGSYQTLLEMDDPRFLRWKQDISRFPSEFHASQNGRYLFLNVRERIPRLGASSYDVPLTAFVWSVTDGRIVRSESTADLVEVIKQPEGVADFIFRKGGKLLIVDSSLQMTDRSISVDDRDVLLNAGERGSLLLAGVDGLLRIKDMRTTTERSLRLDTVRTRVMLDEVRWVADGGWARVRARLVNDSTVVFFSSQLWRSVLQAVVHGRSGPIIIVEGDVDDIIFSDEETYLQVQRGGMIGTSNGSTAHSDTKVINYYALDLEGAEIHLRPVSMTEALQKQSMYHASWDRLYRWREQLLVTGPQIVADRNGMAWAAHRLGSQFEPFPVSARAAIALVRNEKVYGEFWKHIDVEPLIKKALEN